MLRGALGGGRRLVRWLLGVPRPDELQAHISLASDRDRHRTDAIVEASRSSMAGGKGAGSGPQG